MVQLRESYTSDLRQLSHMRGLIVRSCRNIWGNDVEPQVINELELAVQEAATNIIRHAYQGEPGHPIHMQLYVDPEQVQIALDYIGPAFNPESVPPPVFDGTRMGGFGVYLIRQLVDDVVYTHDDGRCRISLMKKRATHPGRSHAHAIDG